MSRLTNMQIKLESNELQTYLDTFNKEIEEGNQNLNASLVDAANILINNKKEDDEEEDTGTYFVDQAGNYYFQPTKDSEPIPSDPPENIQEIIEDCDPELLTEENHTSGTNKTFKNSKKKDDDMNYIFVLSNEQQREQSENDDEGNNESGNENNNVDGDSDGREVYDFDENEESFSRKSNNLVPSNVRIKSKMTTVNVSSHQCPHCEYVTSKRYLLARHMKFHSEERPHKCSVCERGFKTNASLQNHVNTHTGNKPHRCKYCSSTFTTSGELVRHVRYKHTHEKPHKCCECDYASVELSKLKRHIRCHTGERPYQCPHCTYASPDTFKLKRHMRTHTGEKPYECNICHSKFTQSNSLKAHKLIHSVGDKPVFQCHLCPTTCGRKTDLRIHVQKLHTSERPISCKRCGKMFPDRYTYKVHSKTHEGEKCFKCDLCPYASISQRHLDSHLLIHTDQKPYDCKFCEQSFRQKQLLRRHVNLYHNKDYIPPTPQEKTHTCPDCKRAFSRKGNLMRHMASHDPESKISFEKLQLKLGRMNRLDANSVDDTVEILSGLDEEEVDEEIYDIDEEDNDSLTHEMIEAEDDEDVEKYLHNTTSTSTRPIGSVVVKKEDEKELVAVQGIDGQRYMVVEVIQCGEDSDLPTESDKNHNIKNELGEQFIISELTEDEVSIMKSTKNQNSTGMENCFGFDESVENIEAVLSVKTDSNKDSKHNIQLLGVL